MHNWNGFSYETLENCIKDANSDEEGFIIASKILGTTVDNCRFVWDGLQDKMKMEWKPKHDKNIVKYINRAIASGDSEAKSICKAAYMCGKLVSFIKERYELNK